MKRAVKILPDELLRKIVGYVPNKKISIYKNGYKELTRRIVYENLRPNLTETRYYCSFRRGKNRLKTVEVMTYEDPWYGTCHRMALTNKNKNNSMEFEMTKYPYLDPVAKRSRNWFQSGSIFFYFPNGRLSCVPAP
jgi:hypothetical protein